jgi:hypothetical protein
MFEAAVSGARTDEVEGVELVVRPALTAAPIDAPQDRIIVDIYPPYGGVAIHDHPRCEISDR